MFALGFGDQRPSASCHEYNASVVSDNRGEGLAGTDFNCVGTGSDESRRGLCASRASRTFFTDPAALAIFQAARNGTFDTKNLPSHLRPKAFPKLSSSGDRSVSVPADPTTQAVLTGSAVPVPPAQQNTVNMMSSASLPPIYTSAPSSVPAVLHAHAAPAIPAAPMQQDQQRAAYPAQTAAPPPPPAPWEPTAATPKLATGAQGLQPPAAMPFNPLLHVSDMAAWNPAQVPVAHTALQPAELVYSPPVQTAPLQQPMATPLSTAAAARQQPVFPVTWSSSSDPVIILPPLPTVEPLHRSVTTELGQSQFPQPQLASKPPGVIMLPLIELRAPLSPSTAILHLGEGEAASAVLPSTTVARVAELSPPSGAAEPHSPPSSHSSAAAAAAALSALEACLQPVCSMNQQHKELRVRSVVALAMSLAWDECVRQHCTAEGWDQERACQQQPTETAGDAGFVPTRQQLAQHGWKTQQLDELYRRWFSSFHPGRMSYMSSAVMYESVGTGIATRDLRTVLGTKSSFVVLAPCVGWGQQRVAEMERLRAELAPLEKGARERQLAIEGKWTQLACRQQLNRKGSLRLQGSGTTGAEVAEAASAAAPTPAKDAEELQLGPAARRGQRVGAQARSLPWYLRDVLSRIRAYLRMALSPQIHSSGAKPLPLDAAVKSLQSMARVQLDEETLRALGADSVEALLRTMSDVVELRPGDEGSGLELVASAKYRSERVNNLGLHRHCSGSSSKGAVPGVRPPPPRLFPSTPQEHQKQVECQHGESVAQQDIGVGCPVSVIADPVSTPTVAVAETAVVGTEMAGLQSSENNLTGGRDGGHCQNPSSTHCHNMLQSCELPRGPYAFRWDSYGKQLGQQQSPLRSPKRPRQDVHLHTVPAPSNSGRDQGTCDFPAKCLAPLSSSSPTDAPNLLMPSLFPFIGNQPKPCSETLGKRRASDHAESMSSSRAIVTEPEAALADSVALSGKSFGYLSGALPPAGPVGGDYSVALHREWQVAGDMTIRIDQCNLDQVEAMGREALVACRAAGYTIVWHVTGYREQQVLVRCWGISRKAALQALRQYMLEMFCQPLA